MTEKSQFHVEQSFENVIKDIPTKTADSASESLPIKQFDRIHLNAAIQQLIESKGFSYDARQTCTNSVFRGQPPPASADP
jgi:hypothetical protein